MIDETRLNRLCGAAVSIYAYGVERSAKIRCPLLPFRFPLGRLGLRVSHGEANQSLLFEFLVVPYAGKSGFTVPL